MHAIVFNFEIDLPKTNCPDPSGNIAYDNVKRCLTMRGLTWPQGWTYFGDGSVDAVRCGRIVQKLADKHPWFTPSMRDLRMARIEENNDLRIARDDDDD